MMDVGSPAGRVATIVRKEWWELRRNRMVLYIILFVPLLMLALPIGVLLVSGRVPIQADDLQDMRRMLESPVFRGMTPNEAFQAAIASNFLVLFLLMPLMVPVTIAAYSIVGEKMTRSLEPLLATPVSTTELLVGKGLAAAIPGVATAWIAYAVFVVCARYLAVSPRVFEVFVDPMWLVAMFVLAPLLTVLAVNVGIIVSSRTNDPRAAEQLGSLVVLPLIALMLAPMVGIMSLSDTMFLSASVVVACVDVLLLAVAVFLFQRETILTRWK